MNRYLTKQELIAVYELAADLLERYGRRLSYQGLYVHTALGFAYVILSYPKGSRERKTAENQLERLARQLVNAGYEEYNRILDRNRRWGREVEVGSIIVRNSPRLHGLRAPAHNQTPTGLRNMAERIRS